MAALLALTDESEGPATVTISAAANDIDATIAILVQPAGGEAPMPNPHNYRRLDWDDAQAIARIEHVYMVQSAGRVDMRCPIPPPEESA
jgi:hypothetical protein